MFPWWPKHIPINLIPVIRSIGRKLKMGSVERTKDESPSKFECRVAIEPNAPLSLKEQMLWDLCRNEELLALSQVLADGVKLFEMPPQFDAMNEIAIPLKIPEYVQPFPAVVVKNHDDFHFVTATQGTLMIGTYVKRGVYESSTMMDSEKTIDFYLSCPEIITTIGHLDGTEAKTLAFEPETFAKRRFRATLNFLLLCMNEPLTAEKTKLSKHLKRLPVARIARPTVYRPQQIELLRKRYDQDVRCEESGTGSPNRPHWRRAHWRKARVGVGRTGLRLVFVKACFIHRDSLGEPLENTSSTYSYKSRGS